MCGRAPCGIAHSLDAWLPPPHSIPRMTQCLRRARLPATSPLLPRSPHPPRSSFACINCSVKAEGVVPPVTSATMATLNMQQNALGGPLPVEYAAEDGLPNLVNLILIDNQLTGGLAAVAWVAGEC